MLRAAPNAAGQDRQKLNMIIKKRAPVNRVSKSLAVSW